MIDIIFKLGILLLLFLIGMSPFIFMWIRDIHEENKRIHQDNLRCKREILSGALKDKDNELFALSILKTK